MIIYTHIVFVIMFAVFISYINYRFIKFHPATAMMLTSLALAMVLLALDHLGFHTIRNNINIFINQLHFQDILMNCILGLLLFAGSLSLDISHMKQQKWEIGILSIFSTFASTLLVGGMVYYLLILFGLKLTITECFLFGALISPTDPIAILAILKQMKASKNIEILVAAESLFNDGVAIVLFVTLYNAVFAHMTPTFFSLTWSFIHKTLGGILFGAILSAIAYALMKPINDYKIEVLITFALVMGGYTLAQSLGVSGPLAMVTVGIFIANNKHKIFASHTTREYLSSFWEMIDELLNAILFLLVGVEILVVNFTVLQVIVALFAVPIILVARYVTVAIPMHYFKNKKLYPKYISKILTWGGLRGGLAVALALTLPSGHVRDMILPMTYIIVLFSILVQGTTAKKLIFKYRD